MNALAILAIGGLAFVLLRDRGTSPEMEGFCDQCRDPIEAPDSETTTHMELHVSQPPRQLQIGPHSIDLSTREYYVRYCSVACAMADSTDHANTEPTVDLDEVEIPGEELAGGVSD